VVPYLQGLVSAMTRRSADPATFTRGRDFVQFAERAGCRTRQNGSHVIATAANGRICVIPCHNGDLPTGTRRSILRMFARMGLLAAALASVAAMWTWLA
jgi:predicted RNA binding protein YcfA (HicA-like mRNA interferase family)